MWQGVCECPGILALQLRHCLFFWGGSNMSWWKLPINHLSRRLQWQLRMQRGCHCHMKNVFATRVFSALCLPDIHLIQKSFLAWCVPAEKKDSKQHQTTQKCFFFVFPPWIGIFFVFLSQFLKFCWMWFFSWKNPLFWIRFLPHKSVAPTPKTCKRELGFLIIRLILPFCVFVCVFFPWVLMCILENFFDTKFCPCFFPSSTNWFFLGGLAVFSAWCETLAEKFYAKKNRPKIGQKSSKMLFLRSAKMAFFKKLKDNAWGWGWGDRREIFWKNSRPKNRLSKVGPPSLPTPRPPPGWMSGWVQSIHLFNSSFQSGWVGWALDPSLRVPPGGTFFPLARTYPLMTSRGWCHTHHPNPPQIGWKPFKNFPAWPLARPKSDHGTPQTQG